jgi:hypothetical protein
MSNPRPHIEITVDARKLAKDFHLSMLELFKKAHDAELLAARQRILAMIRTKGVAGGD